jgi:Mrp family chromosome partitioning ATPase
LVDATMLVVSAQATSRRSLLRAALMLEQVGAQLKGTVLNAAKIERAYDGERLPPTPTEAAKPSKKTRHEPEAFGHQPEPEPVHG